MVKVNSALLIFFLRKKGLREMTPLKYQALPSIYWKWSSILVNISPGRKTLKAAEGTL